jgi:hypothetical protein
MQSLAAAATTSIPADQTTPIRTFFLVSARTAGSLLLNAETNRQMPKETSPAVAKKRKADPYSAMSLFIVQSHTASAKTVIFNAT